MFLSSSFLRLVSINNIVILFVFSDFYSFFFFPASNINVLDFFSRSDVSRVWQGRVMLKTYLESE